MTFITDGPGHSSVAFTMDVYSHIIEGMQEDAMALLDEVLAEGVSKEINTQLTRNSDIMSGNPQFLASGGASSIGRAADS